VGNAPGWVVVSAATNPEDWREILPRTRVQPDTRHRFLIDDQGPATRLRLDVIPDGGLARLRALGTLTPEGLTFLHQRWQATTPEDP
jgi:allantoicase